MQTARTLLAKLTQPQLVELAIDLAGGDESAITSRLSVSLDIGATVARTERAPRRPKAAAKSAVSVHPKTVSTVRDSIVRGMHTVGAIAGNTGIGVATVSKALKHLVSSGAVEQQGKRNAQFHLVAVTANGAAVGVEA